MNKIVGGLIRTIIRYFYPYFKEVEKEFCVKNKQNIINTFKSVGHKCVFGNDYCIYGTEYISIGENFNARRGLRLEAITGMFGLTSTPQITIGENVSIEDWCHIGCIERIEIGSGTTIASKVFITDHYHGSINKKDIGTKALDRPLSSKPVVIGKNVWIGDGVCIMPGTTLGDNVIVGANAVVTHSFPENCVIAGCPAKIIKALS